MARVYEHLCLCVGLHLWKERPLSWSATPRRRGDHWLNFSTVHSEINDLTSLITHICLMQVPNRLSYLTGEKLRKEEENDDVCLQLGAHNE